MDDGKELYTKTWLPDGPIKAKLVFVHGFSDHINRYYDFFPDLAERNIATYGFDQRGWGRSVTKPAEKGRTGTTARVLADIVAVATPQLPTSPSDPPLFIAGHSMGGGEVMYLACDPTYKDFVSKVRGFLLEGPFIGFAPELEPSIVTVVLGRLASKVVPHRHMVQRIPPENITRDPAVAKDLHEDDLCHDTGTLEGLASMLDRTNSFSGGKSRPGKHVRALWLGHGTEDKGTAYGASKQYFDKYCGDIEDREFKTYEGYYHMLHADGKEASAVYTNDFANWILARVEDKAEAKL
ncbi:lysophospholipase-like protein [Thozetella sp. PMI_491]|nr:lysophospholipase-like protein [Thozetella sp. PMI_491]